MVRQTSAQMAEDPACPKPLHAQLHLPRRLPRPARRSHAFPTEAHARLLARTVVRACRVNKHV